MKFEDYNKCVELKRMPTTFVYFLLDGDEVVYVGKTNKGIPRIYTHTNKYFTHVFMLPCDELELDELESRYIIKYKPRYNKIPNHKGVYPIKKAMLDIKRTYINNCKNSKHKKDKYTMKQFLQILDELNIEVITFRDELYISQMDMREVEDEIEAFLMGDSDNEIFNIWF